MVNWWVVTVAQTAPVFVFSKAGQSSATPSITSSMLSTCGYSFIFEFLTEAPRAKREARAYALPELEQVVPLSMDNCRLLEVMLRQQIKNLQAPSAEWREVPGIFRINLEISGWRSVCQ